ncbi:hypothetical protein JCM10212_001319 [Sporobolomyces blumeae]
MPAPTETLTVPEILSLPRPQAPLVNPSSTLAAWPSTSFSFDQSRTDKSVYLVRLPRDPDSLDSAWDKVTRPTKVLDGLTRLDLAWLDDTTFIYLRPVRQDVASDRVDHPVDVNDEQLKREIDAWKKEPGGQGTEVWAFDVESREDYKVGQFPVDISDLETLQVASGTATATDGPPAVVLAFSALVFPDGLISTYRAQAEQLERDLAGSDIRVYDETFVRHWDEWCPTKGQKKQVFFVRMSKNPQQLERTGDRGEGRESDDDGFEHVDAREGRWTFEHEDDLDESTSTIASSVRELSRREPKVYSPLAGTKFECPVGPFGSSSDYTLSSTHLAFHAKDPHVSPSWHTRTNVYVVPLSPRSAEDRVPKMVSVGTQGASSSPRFSRDGIRLAWLEMREDGYEADRNRVMVHDLDTGETKRLTEEWDLSPSNVEWDHNGTALILTVEERGHVKLFKLDLETGRDAAQGIRDDEHAPVALTDRHSVSACQPLASGDILASIHSFTHPNELYLVRVPRSTSSASAPDTDNAKKEKRRKGKPTVHPVASLTRDLLKSKRLSPGEEFTFSGSEGRDVHGWILFPPSHPSSRRLATDDETPRQTRGIRQVDDVDKTSYPLAFVCHGGPQSAWNDSWSTRWNLNSYTGKGYITVAINRTGSTGFGQEFCDAIKNDWGGAPFRDLVAGVEFVKQAWPEIDGDRMASLGASYGGFMQNWIQGHNDAFGFKCLVCHDGVFSLANTYYATEELYFPTREFGGAPWEVPENYEKFNPANHIKRWRTPQLVIHGSRDYRLVESEGLAAFNTLQRLGVPSRLLIFPSENHWVLSPQNSRKWHEEVFRWIGEFTRTEA